MPTGQLENLLRSVPVPTIPQSPGTDHQTYTFYVQLLDYIKALTNILTGENITNVFIDNGIGLPEGDPPSVLLKAVGGTVYWLAPTDSTNKDYVLMWDHADQVFKWIETTDECPT